MGFETKLEDLFQNYAIELSIPDTTGMESPIPHLFHCVRYSFFFSSLIIDEKGVKL